MSRLKKMPLFKEVLIGTWSGKFVDLTNVQLTHIDIKDVAHHLSNICRFNGACKYHYSVAQHCYYASLLVPEEDRLWALLHDGPEYLYGDILRPMRRHSLFAPIVEHIFEPFDRRFFRRFGLIDAGEPWLGFPPSVKKADDALCVAEGQQVMLHDQTHLWTVTKGRPAEITIERWTPEFARMKFLYRFEELHEN